MKTASKVIVLGKGWTPKSYNGLALWLKADAITGLADDDAATTWIDSSPNGRNATQVTPDNKPLYKTNIQNGKPVVRFDGSNDFLAATIPQSATQHWFLVMRKRTAASSTNNIPWELDTGAAAQLFADTDIVEVGSTMYLYYAGTANGGSADGAMRIKLATGPTSMITG